MVVVDVEGDFMMMVEVPYNSRVKYEYDKASGCMLVDRVLQSGYVYPGNYGYIPDTMSEDGDPVDVLLLMDEVLYPGVMVKARAVGVLYTKDGKSVDSMKCDPKVIAVPSRSVDMRYDNINDIEDVSMMRRNIIYDFYENYKNNQVNSYVKVIGWGNYDDAMNVINSSVCK